VKEIEELDLVDRATPPPPGISSVIESGIRFSTVHVLKGVCSSRRENGDEVFKLKALN
jgi:hypothetical protein